MAQVPICNSEVEQTCASLTQGQLELLRMGHIWELSPCQEKYKIIHEHLKPNMSEVQICIQSGHATNMTGLWISFWKCLDADPKSRELLTGYQRPVQSWSSCFLLIRLTLWGGQWCDRSELCALRHVSIRLLIMFGNPSWRARPHIVAPLERKRGNQDY